ncbi:MAG: serine/threonine protein kinase [Deltaproteobacteria bacterium]|nr:serine/threonine protein kinase [Deltaproteobacteria bacterium]
MGGQTDKKSPFGIKRGSVVGGRYEIERPIGRGGFSWVYQARHNATDQLVAIKVLARAPDPVVMRRFMQEARVTAGLKHSNTVRVFDVGEDDGGFLYLAMELLTGRSLRTALQERVAAGTAFSEREAIHLAIEVTRSLGEAHAAGLVHRDLKLDNIFLHEVPGDDLPAVKVLDFGIAKLADTNLTLDSDSGTLGTPLYMSPEQIEKAELDARSDLYSLGVVMFALVSGDVPFRGTTPLATMYQHVHERAPSLLERAKVPVSLKFARIVAAALEKDPAKRPSSAKALREALLGCRDEPETIPLVRATHSPTPLVPAKALEATGPSAGPLEHTDQPSFTLTQPTHPSSQKLALMGLALAVAAFVGTIIVVSIWFAPPSPEPPPAEIDKAPVLPAPAAALPIQPPDAGQAVLDVSVVAAAMPIPAASPDAGVAPASAPDSGAPAMISDPQPVRAPRPPPRSKGPVRPDAGPAPSSLDVKI